MAQKPKLTEEQKIEIRKLHDAGMPYPALAAKYNVAPATIMRACRQDLYERQKASNRKHQAENYEKIYAGLKKTYKNYRLSFHTVNDANVIEQLDKQDNVQDYVRQLVTNDIDDKDKQTGNNN